jgi:hypothetical protein
MSNITANNEIGQTAPRIIENFDLQSDKAMPAGYGITCMGVTEDDTGFCLAFQFVCPEGTNLDTAHTGSLSTDGGRTYSEFEVSIIVDQNTRGSVVNYWAIYFDPAVARGSDFSVTFVVAAPGSGNSTYTFTKKQTR